MRIAAKGVLETGYWQFGRKWPRDRQLELDVTPEEYAAISADRNIVCVVIPEEVKSHTQVKRKEA